MDLAMVSVIIPSYNRAATVEKAIRSVLRQTYTNLELILVDDGSQDNTRDVVMAIADPRVHYIYQPNAGACAARNHGIREAQGEVIAFQDSDDVWHPDKLEKQMRVMVEKQADVVFCKQIHICQGKETKLTPKRINEGFLSGNEDIFGVGTQTIVARKQVLEQECFDVSMPRLQDTELLYRLIRRFKVYCLDDGLVDYIVGDDSITMNHEKRFQAMRLFIEKHPEIPAENPFFSLHFMKDLWDSWRKVKAEGKQEGGKYLRLSLRYFPGPLRTAKALLGTKAVHR